MRSNGVADDATAVGQEPCNALNSLSFELDKLHETMSQDAARLNRRVSSAG